jgi:hypothetical protein
MSQGRRLHEAFVAIILLAFFALPISLKAQSTFGSIVGTIKDKSGALVPGASVTLTNTGTAAAKTIKSDEHGDYSFLNLNPGKYQVTVVAAGFEKTDFADLDLQSRVRGRHHHRCFQSFGDQNGP